MNKIITKGTYERNKEKATRYKHDCDKKITFSVVDSIVCTIHTN